MRHNDILRTLQNLTLRTPKQKEIAEALNVKISVIGNRSARNSNYSLEDLVKLSTYFGVDLIAESNYKVNSFVPTVGEKNETEAISVPITVEDIKTETQNKSITIQYWNDCDINSEKIINPCFSELLLDMQKVIHTYKKNPENLKFIAMPGDEMDGGVFPIKNNDLLVIDISINDTSSTGVYFCQNNSSIFVRRITELVGEGIYISVDNPLYSDILNGRMTYQELEDVGFKVIGKVIGNESIRL